MRSFCISANKHPGGSLSAVELMTALFFSGVADFSTPDMHTRDTFICSKGHAGSPLYFALWALGYFPGLALDDLLKFGELGSSLPRMPWRDMAIGVEMSTGSLGQGLSFGLGSALADRRAHRPGHTYVLLGDGECTEGQVWEAALTGSRCGMTNVTAILDANGSGSHIRLDRDQWAARWSGFGWFCAEVDGHDLSAVAQALDSCRNASGPAVAILHTVKGRGLGEPLEGSNTLSSEIPAASKPKTNLQRDVDAALAVIDQAFPEAVALRVGTDGTSRQSRPAAPSLPRDRTLAALSSHPPGLLANTKQTGGELLDELQGFPLLALSPDAIRNSGLLPHMEKIGSWHFENPASDVLECHISEQDAASLAAGSAAGGLRPILFSMEGFYWRMLDQIRQSIIFSRLPVTLVGTSGGVGDLLGPMVQSDRLLSVLRCMDLDIFEAADVNTAKLLFAEILAAPRPAYLRLPHEPMAPLRPLEELAGEDLSRGYWILEDVADPDFILLTAGALRTSALTAARRLRDAHDLRIRVIEVFSPTRFAARSQEERDAVIPPDRRSASVHNAPSSVLGEFLTSRSVAVGADGWGVAGSPIDRLYREVGLDVESIVTRIKKLF